MSVITQIWFGTEDSKVEYSSLLNKAGDTELELKARSHYENDEQDTYLLDIQDGVGTISIKGALLPFSNSFTQWLGMTGYPDIRNALIEAAQSPAVKEIFLDIDSPGGAAKGLEDISALVQRVNDDFKPVTAYTSGTMASAAYRIGVSAGALFASKMSVVGSIGATATHIEVTKALEAQGITPTVFRSGEFKALGGPYEELSDTAAGIIQHKIDSYNKEFVEYVAMRRGTSPAVVEETMGKGREFFGHEALKVNLIDGIMTIDQINTRLRQSAQAKLSSSPQAVLSTASTAINMETEMAKQKVLDDKTVAVIAAGGDVETALENAPEAEEGAPEAQEAEAAAEEGAEVEAPQASAEKADDGLVSYLKGQLAEANEKISQLTMDNRDLKTRSESMSSTHEQLRKIAQDFTATRTVALGRPSPDLTSLSDEALISQFTQVSQEFHKTFPVGGKCAAPSTEPENTTMPRSHKSAVRASRI